MPHLHGVRPGVAAEAAPAGPAAAQGAGPLLAARRRLALVVLVLAVGRRRGLAGRAALATICIRWVPSRGMKIVR